MKPLLKLSTVKRSLWSKITKERLYVDYVLIAELSGQKEPLFASNIESDLEKRFPHNSHQRLKEISIYGKKSPDSRYLELTFSDDKSCKLDQGNFTLLVSCPNVDESGKECRDNLFYFYIPELVSSQGIKQCYFPDDAEEGTALALFLLSAVFIGGN